MKPDNDFADPLGCAKSYTSSCTPHVLQTPGAKKRWRPLARKFALPRPGVWLHDRQDGNGDAHLKAGLVGPSETIPVIEGTLGLSTCPGIFFCEFDGPRSDRRVSVTVLADR